MAFKAGASVVVPFGSSVPRFPILLMAFSRQACTKLEEIVNLDSDIDNWIEAVRRIGVQDVIQVRTLVFPDTRGHSGALNGGASQARGRVPVMCDGLEPAQCHVSGCRSGPIAARWHLPGPPSARAGRQPSFLTVMAELAFEGAIK